MLDPTAVAPAADPTPPPPPDPQPDNVAAAGAAPAVSDVVPAQQPQPQVLTQPTEQVQPTKSPDQFGEQAPTWHRVLAGVAAGLARGGILGGVVGGIAGATHTQEQYRQEQINKAQQDTVTRAESNMKLNYANAQSALALASMAKAGMELNNLPQDEQINAFDRQAAALTAARNAGLVPHMVTPADSEAVQASLQGINDSRGSMPYMSVLHIGGTSGDAGGQLVGFSLPESTDSQGAVDFVNQFLAMTGQAHLPQSTYDKLPPKTQQELLNQAIQFGTEVATDKNATGLAAKYRSFSDAYSQRLDADPDVKTRLNAIATSYEKSAAGYQANAKSLVQEKADAAAKSKMSDPVVAVVPDGQGGTVNQVMERGNVPAGAFAYKADPAKLNATVAGFNDVQTKINQFAAVDFANVQAGLADAIIGKEASLGFSGINVPLDRFNAMLRSENLGSANQATRDFVVGYLGAREALTQLPRLQTFGQSSRVTEQQMQAAQAQLPQAGDDAAMAKQKLNALQSILDPLRKQVPRMPGAPLIPSFREQQ